MDRPRRRSSASRSGSWPVSARTRVDLPWSTWPAVARTCTGQASRGDPEAAAVPVAATVAATATVTAVTVVAIVLTDLLIGILIGFGVTATTFLLVGLTKLDLADHQRFTFKYAFLTSLVMSAVAVLVGVLPL